MKRWARWMLPLVALGAGMTAVANDVRAADNPVPVYRIIAPAITRGEDPPAPTPAPPYTGPVASLYLESAGITNSAPVEPRGTHYENGKEVFDDPSAPANIAWYADPRFGHPGFRGQNSVFSGHINYVNYGNGPFARLTSAQPGSALYVTMDNGTQYAYTVLSVTVVPLDVLVSGGMDPIIFPMLDEHTERVTLISCGGDFVPRAGGGGEYTSRVVLVAERYVP